MEAVHVPEIASGGALIEKNTPPLANFPNNCKK
jgi:hypothetical protein